MVFSTPTQRESSVSIAAYYPLIMLLFFASTASFAVWSGAYFLGITPKMEHIITWWFIVFGVYGVNRYTDIEDYLNDSTKRDFFMERKKYLFLAVSLLSASVLWLLAVGSLTIYHILCIYAGIAYSVPLFPWITPHLELRWVRLKEITFIKSFLVSLIIGTSFFAFYFMDKNIQVSRVEVLTLMIGSSLSMFINTVFCDIRDFVGDKASGVRTIPVVMNIRNTIIYFIVAPSIVWLLILFVLTVFSLISTPIFLFLLAILLYPVVYFGLYSTKKTPDKVTFLIADACVPVFAVGLVVLRVFVY